MCRRFTIALGGCMMLMIMAFELPDPDPCPSVPTSGGFEVGLHLQYDIDDGIKELLNDPDSYKRDSMHASPALSEVRSDGTKYYTRLNVQFRARNVFGGMTQDYGLVGLFENGEGHCSIASTTLGSNE